MQNTLIYRWQSLISRYQLLPPFETETEATSFLNVKMIRVDLEFEISSLDFEKGKATTTSSKIKYYNAYENRINQ